MHVSSRDNENLPSSKLSGFDKKSIIIILLVFIIVGASGGVGYYFGLQVGKKQGANQLISSVTDILNPVNAISKNTAFPYTLIGSATKVSDDSITVKKADGESSTVKVNSSTAVTRNSKVIKISEVKQNEGVTIFTSGKDGDQVATRIIVK